MNEHEATEIAYKNGYKQGKAEVAREIFKEIQKSVIHRILHDEDYSLDSFTKDLDELKNKYTEEGK